MKIIFRNQINIYFLLICLLAISCKISSKERPYHLLDKYSGLNFNRAGISIVKYKEEMSGMTRSEGIIEAIFKIGDLNIDSLKREMMDLGYKKLPITELDMGDGDNGSVKQSDAGFYKLSLLHKSIIDILVIVDFTQREIILYKLIQ